MRLMSITCFHASTGFDDRGVGPVMPALATRMSGGRICLRFSPRASLIDCSFVTSTSSAMVPGSEGNRLRARVDVAIPQRDPAAAGGDPGGAGRPDAARAPVTMAVRSLNIPACMAVSQILEFAANSTISAHQPIGYTEPRRRRAPQALPRGFMSSAIPASIDATLDLLKGGDYIADRSLATVLYLALKLGRPLFCEGEAGVGKTEIAKVLATTLGRPLIRLQCYEASTSPRRSTNGTTPAR